MGLISEEDQSIFEPNGDGRELLVCYQTYKKVRRRKGRKERERESIIPLGGGFIKISV
jgi:hypothetical protein